LLYPAPVCRTHVLFGNGVKNSRATASWYGAEPAADNGYFNFYFDAAVADIVVRSRP
jgi:hypothetical protein